uniref:Signal recognition particle receptor subunit n=1 Tax=Echinococcus granulosus TaxID=6210 RepID=A0A068WCM2_ECHGR|nr:signal recognition particle receptor subunit [Echinococcus granulosus]
MRVCTRSQRSFDAPTMIISEGNLSNGAFVHESIAMKHFMDNEFDLLYIVCSRYYPTTPLQAGYQRVLQLSYVDKFLTTIALEFRDKYKNELLEKNRLGYFNDFRPTFDSKLREIEVESRKSIKAAKPMRSFADSAKSKKTIASMIVSKDNQNPTFNTEKRINFDESPNSGEPIFDSSITPLQSRKTKLPSPKSRFVKMNKKPKEFSSPSESPVSAKPGKKVKMNRRWTDEAVGAEAAALDYSGGGGAANSSPGGFVCNGTNAVVSQGLQLTAIEVENLTKLRGTLREGFDELEISSDEEEYVESSDEKEQDSEVYSRSGNGIKASFLYPNKSFGFMSGLLQTLKTTASGRVLTHEDIRNPLERLRDHLVHKNVAFEIANRLCDGVAESLVGVQLGRFERVGPRVRSALEEACTRLLASGRRVDVLRDALEAQQSGKPYVIVFCGVNGVGKSTNLAKIAFWLIEKNLKVLIAACDTFRSGAVEQLRTHVQKLNFIHPPEHHNGQTMVELYEKGYGKDAANIAMSAISYAKEKQCDVVLVDTAGRMQDNELLMRALAKLIIVNEPDLVLFVGEALVGNEAIDQLVKFNQSLTDYSNTAKPHTIDGIVLTKFDTIDDKVGAAVSMAHISGQPIVFVGTGQTYSDLRQFSVPSVVKALMNTILFIVFRPHFLMCGVIIIVLSICGPIDFVFLSYLSGWLLFHLVGVIEWR